MQMTWITTAITSSLTLTKYMKGQPQSFNVADRITSDSSFHKLFTYVFLVDVLFIYCTREYSIKLICFIQTQIRKTKYYKTVVHLRK